MMELKNVIIRIIPDRTDGIGARRVVLGPETRRLPVGRSSKVDLKNLHPATHNAYFDSRVMSRNHVELRTSPKDQKVYITDTSSMHGTLVNGIKLSPGVGKVLKSNDILRFGTRVVRGSESHQPLTAVVHIRWEDRPTQPQSQTRPKEKPVASAKEETKESEPQPATRSRNTFVVPDNDDSEDEYDDDDDVEIVEPPTKKENPTSEEIEKVAEESVEAEEPKGSESESESEDDAESDGLEEDGTSTGPDGQGISDSESSVGDVLEVSSPPMSHPGGPGLDFDNTMGPPSNTEPHTVSGDKRDTVIPTETNLKKAEPLVSEFEAGANSVEAAKERGEADKNQDIGSTGYSWPRDSVNLDNPAGPSLFQMLNESGNPRYTNNTGSLPTASGHGSHWASGRGNVGCGTRPLSRGRPENGIPGRKDLRSVPGDPYPTFQRNNIPSNNLAHSPFSYDPLMSDTYLDGPFSLDFGDFSCPPGYNRESPVAPGVSMLPGNSFSGVPQRTARASAHNSCPPPSGGYPNSSNVNRSNGDPLHTRLGRLLARMNEDNATDSKKADMKTSALSVSRSDPRTLLQQPGDSSLKRKRDDTESGFVQKSSETKTASPAAGATDNANSANTGVRAANASIEKNVSEPAADSDAEQPRRKRAKTSSRSSNVTRYAVSVLAGAVVGGVGTIVGLAALPAGFFG